MSKKRLINLEHLSILELNGEGSFQLLQGQITSDVNKATINNPEIGAICDIKGRVVSSFTVIKNTASEGYLLIGDKSVLQKTEEILMKYQPFYDVEIKVNEDFKFYGIHEEYLVEYYPQTDLEKSYQLYDSFWRIHFLKKKYHILITKEDLFEDNHEVQIEEWFIDDIQNKNFEISSKSIGMFTPHELGYHLSSRVDFEKGCYTGQEIVARMHYRAKKLPSLLVKSSSSFLEDYSKVFDANKTAIGIILSSIKHGESFHNLLSMNKNFENQEFEI